MVSATSAGIPVGSWVARFHTYNDERPEIGLVRDAWDGNLSLEIYSSYGRPVGRLLAQATGTKCANEWEPIDPPDFARLSAVFSYGKFVMRRKSERVRPPLALLQSARPPD